MNWTHDDAAKVLARFDTSPHRKARIAFALATGAEKRAIKNAKRTELGKVHGTKTKRRERSCFVVFPWQTELLEIARAGADGADGAAFTDWANSTRDLADACTAADVQGLSMHDLQHVFAGWALDDGSSMLEVAKALGHRNTRQLEERYDNRDAGVLRRRAEEQAAQRRHSRQLVAIEGGKSTAVKAAS